MISEIIEYSFKALTVIVDQSKQMIDVEVIFSS